ncbi:MAG TPA: hypothetical protein VKC53_03585 [Patescibacteria group bacterium]|nr:hypothetical protein [Patescibacteria group bacterium]
MATLDLSKLSIEFATSKNSGLRDTVPNKRLIKSKFECDPKAIPLINVLVEKAKKSSRELTLYYPWNNREEILVIGVGFRIENDQTEPGGFRSDYLIDQNGEMSMLHNSGRTDDNFLHTEVKKVDPRKFKNALEHFLEYGSGSKEWGDRDSDKNLELLKSARGRRL